MKLMQLISLIGDRQSVRSAAYSILVLAATLFILTPLVADPDLWGHVRFGQDTLLTHQVVRPDPYSYLTAGQRWINHEWLAEMIYALAYNAAGPIGLIALNSTLSLLIVGLIYWRLRRAAMGASVAILLTLLVSLVLRPAVLNVRPQVFTYLLFLLLLLLIDAYPSPHPTQSWGVWFPLTTSLILALWVNLHGGVLAGLGILYLWGLLYLIEAAWRSRSLSALTQPPMSAVLAALLLAPLPLLLNPYGPDLIVFLLRTATVARPEIIEWQPVRLAATWGLLWIALALLTVIAVALSRRPRRMHLLTPLVVIALLPLSALRHIPLFAVAAPVLAADHFADLSARLQAWAALRWRGLPPTVRSVPLLAAAATAVLIVLAVPRLQAIEVQPASAGFPVNAVAVLKAARVRGNMATEFNWGEFVIWHLGPDVRVSVDGRRETVYSEAIYRENLDFMLGEGDWDRLIDRPETNLALVDRERPVFNLMREKAGWVLAYEDPAAALFVRADSPFLAAIQAVEQPEWPGDGAGLPFPVE